jgi:hypothetical protein
MLPTVDGNLTVVHAYHLRSHGGHQGPDSDAFQQMMSTCTRG